MENVIYLIPALGIIGLIVMAIKSAWVNKQDAGDKNMQELAGYIADGAMAFLKAEWKVLSIFVVFASALLAYSGTIHEINGKEVHGSWIISIAFIVSLSCLPPPKIQLNININLPSLPYTHVI